MSRSNQSKAPRAPPLPRLPRFSPARLRLYLFCPRAYFLHYHRGLKWGGMTAGHAFGGHLHRALQQFHEQGGAEFVPLEQLLGQLRERWNAAHFPSPEEGEAHLTAGEAVLQQYYNTVPEPGRETLWTEKMVQHRYPDYVLIGKVDRLDRRPDRSLEVIDYKSGRLTVTEEEVRDSLALSIYQLLVARQNPGVPVYATLLCLRSGATASTLRSPEELDQVETEVGEVVHAILRDEQMLAVPGDQCRDCVYPPACPPGRRWLREHATIA
jgi:putative RecB family exonuclease